MADDTNTLPIFRANFELVLALSQLSVSQIEEYRTLFEAHIERWSNSTRIVSADFEPGLQWFNVTQPLSLKKDLRGKIVVLDFFTHCCVNCQHILPDLQELERTYSVEDGVVVIGVHSPKFEHEKDPSSVLNAVLRNEISHPVVNDPACKLWQMLFVNCWPTMVILGPEAQILFIFMGEGHRNGLLDSVRMCLDYFKQRGRIAAHSLPLRSEKSILAGNMLSFPGKICLSGDGSLMAIADSGHHRIIIATNVGLVVEVVGRGVNGFGDGDFANASFVSPQGLAWNRDTIYVADSGNHAIRKINLIKRTVETVAGNGQLGSDEEGGGLGKCQSLNSPWDVLLVNSTASPPEDPDVLLIANAGSHQIWLLALKDGVRWYKLDETLPASACVRVYGSGKEEHRNNMYAFKAGFAQPSGLTLDQQNQVLYVADSESSSIRGIGLLDGNVKNVVGASRDPTDLFVFGDVDGQGGEVRLQHPLAVAYSHRQRLLYVADTFNHKIKIVDPVTRTCKTFAGDQNGDRVGAGTESALDEPGGMCLHEDGDRSVLFIADTNNHCIKALDLRENRLIKLSLIYHPELLAAPTSVVNADSFKSDATIINVNPVHILHEETVEFNLAVRGMIMEEMRPQWRLNFSHEEVIPHIQLTGVDGTELQLRSGTISSCVQKPFFFLRTKSTYPEKDVPVFTMFLDLMFVVCDKTAKVCMPKHLRFVIPCKRLVENSKKSSTNFVDIFYLVGAI